MAEFCGQCSQDHFGTINNDFIGLSTESDDANELYSSVICEGCGSTYVDSHGMCVLHMSSHPEISCLVKQDSDRV